MEISGILSAGMKSKSKNFDWVCKNVFKSELLKFPMKDMIQISWFAFAEINIELPKEPIPITNPETDWTAVIVIPMLWEAEI